MRKTVRQTADKGNNAISSNGKKAPFKSIRNGYSAMIEYVLYLNDRMNKE